MLITHGACRKTWSGNRAAHCGGCHETFTGITAFDAHQSWPKGSTPTGLCRLPADAGLEPRQQSWGVLWAMPNTGEQWWNHDEPDEEPAA